jgi:hypothetical protein
MNHRIVNKLKCIGLLLDQRRAKLKCCMLTEEKMEGVSVRLEYSPQKSFRCLAQETRVSSFNFICSFPTRTFTCECGLSVEVPGRHTLQQRAFPASSVIWRSF